MGTPFDCSTNHFDVELGSRIETMVPCFQSIDVLWFAEGEKAEENRMVQRQLFPCLYYFIQVGGTRSRYISKKEVEIFDIG